MNINLFSDVADALQINDPAIVEKDYYVVQLLKSLNELQQDYYDVIFAGGTCLAKTYENIHRMSEDIDVKLKPVGVKVTEGQRRKFSENIIKLIEKHSDFELVDKPFYRDGRRVQKFTISYPFHYEKTSSLRPNILLELVEKEIHEPNQIFSISSMCAKTLNEKPEIDKIQCVNLESIISEKIVSLLWRTSALANDVDIEDDEALIRHIYDIHRIYKRNPGIFSDKKLIILANDVLQSDSKRYGSKYSDFINSPYSVIEQGLDIINSDPKHAERYDKYVKDLIYSIKAPEWSELLNTLDVCYESVFKRKN